MNALLTIGGVATKKGRIRPPCGPVIVAVAEELNERLIACNWLDSAPFGLVSLVLRFGDQNPDTQIASINKTHSELPVSRELSMSECIDRARNGTLLQYFRTETVTALTDVARRYDLSMDWNVA